MCDLPADVKFRLLFILTIGKMQARDVDCRCGEINLRGYLAFDGSVAESGRACWRFTKGSASANLRWNARAGSMMRTALYSEQADRRSWAAMKGLFDEVLT